MGGIVSITYWYCPLYGRAFEIVGIGAYQHRRWCSQEIEKLDNIVYSVFPSVLYADHNIDSFLLDVDSKCLSSILVCCIL